MSKLPLPSEETKIVPIRGPKNWMETFQAYCKRNGTDMTKRFLFLMQADLEQNLDNDVVPTAVLMTVKEIVGGIWVNRQGTVREPSLKPVVCIACGKEQDHVPPDMADQPAHGYCHHVKVKGPNDQCVCLDCLVATAIMATSHEDLMSTKIEGFYNLNKWGLQNDPEVKRVNAKLESYRATYFMNLPQLNDATDEEVLSCFTMKVERGAARRDTDFDQMLEYSDEFELNSYAHPDTKIRPAEAYKPTAREWKKEWYAYPTKWLLDEGREILAAPHRASHPVKVARNLTFDAAALALKKATGRATLAEIMDAAVDATRPPVAAPAPVQAIVQIHKTPEELAESFRKIREDVRKAGSSRPFVIGPEPGFDPERARAEWAKAHPEPPKDQSRVAWAIQPPTPIAAKPVQVPTQLVVTSIRPEGLSVTSGTYWQHQGNANIVKSNTLPDEAEGRSEEEGTTFYERVDLGKVRLNNTGKTIRFKNPTVDTRSVDVPNGGYFLEHWRT